MTEAPYQLPDQRDQLSGGRRTLGDDAQTALVGQLGALRPSAIDIKAQVRLMRRLIEAKVRRGRRHRAATPAKTTQTTRPHPSANVLAPLGPRTAGWFDPSSEPRGAAGVQTGNIDLPPIRAQPITRVVNDLRIIAGTRTGLTMIEPLGPRLRRPRARHRRRPCAGQCSVRRWQVRFALRGRPQ